MLKYIITAYMRENNSIEEKICSFAPYAELMPGVIIIHELEKLAVQYMSSTGLKLLGITLQELQNIGDQYHEQFFNMEDAEIYIFKLKELLHKNSPTESFTFFQQVKIKDIKNWVWHISSTRIFHVDETGRPTHIISTAIPIDQMKHIPEKAERLLTENIFFKNNVIKFMSLGNRAKEILKLVALGKSSAEIAGELFISVETVSTHRKLIKQKLGISTTTNS